MDAPSARIDIGHAAKDAGLTALLTFFLLLPLIGFKTVQNIHNELALDTRFPLLFVFVALAAGGRFVYALTVLRWRERRARRTRAPPRDAARGPGRLARLLAPGAPRLLLLSPVLLPRPAALSRART